MHIKLTGTIHIEVIIALGDNGGKELAVSTLEIAGDL